MLDIIIYIEIKNKLTGLIGHFMAVPHKPTKGWQTTVELHVCIVWYVWWHFDKQIHLSYNTRTDTYMCVYIYSSLVRGIQVKISSLVARPPPWSVGTDLYLSSTIVIAWRPTTAIFAHALSHIKQCQSPSYGIAFHITDPLCGGSLTYGH